MNNNDWIKDKKSWMIVTTASGNGTFEPRDPICGRWTLAELERVFGTEHLTVLPLEGKWTGEVLIYQRPSQTPTIMDSLSASFVNPPGGESISTATYS